MEWIIVVGAIVLVIVICILAVRKRIKGLRRAADELGLSFEKEPKHILDSEFQRFRLFQLGHRRVAGNLMQGAVGNVELWLFDYCYITGSGQHTNTLCQTVVAFPMDNTSLPDFELRPENVFQKIGSAMGYQDIDLDQYPEFSSRYLLRGRDEEAIRRLFDSGPALFLESCPKICIEGGGNWLVLYHAHKRVRARKLSQFLNEALQVRAAFVNALLSSK